MVRQKDEYKEVNDRKQNVLPYFTYELYGNSGQMVPLHWHDEIEILYAKVPGKLFIDGQVVTFDVNDIMFVNARQLHSTSLVYGGLVYHILIDPWLFCISPSQSLSENNLHFPMKLPADNGLYPAIIDKLVSIERPVRPENELYVMKLLYEMLVCIQEEHHLTRNHVYDNSVQIQYVKSSIAYIKENALRGISANDIANAVSISRGHLMRLFKTYTGETISTYIQNYRLEEAEQMLVRNSGSIADIAYDCGFADSAHFCHRFKERYGCTPISYRKQHSSVQDHV